MSDPRCEHHRGFTQTVTQAAGATPRKLLQWESAAEPDLRAANCDRGSAVVDLHVTYDLLRTENGVVNDARTPASPYLSTDEIDLVGVLTYGQEKGSSTVEFDVGRSTSICVPSLAFSLFLKGYPPPAAGTNPDLAFSCFASPGTRGGNGPGAAARRTLLLTLPIDASPMSNFVAVPKSATSFIVLADSSSEYSFIVAEQLPAPFDVARLAKTPAGAGKEPIPLVSGCQGLVLTSTHAIAGTAVKCRVVFLLSL